MSLTEDIALLVSRTNALLSTFENKSSEINIAVAAAVAAAPAVHRDVFVDPLAGNDDNVGSSNSPVMTIDRALEMGGMAAALRIYLLGDVVMTQFHFFNGFYLELRGARRPLAGEAGFPEQRRSLTFNGLAVTMSGYGNLSPGINLAFGGSFITSAVDFSIPAIATPLVHNKIIDFSSAGAAGCHLIRSNISAAAGSTLSLIGVLGATRLTIGVVDCTILASARGRILDGVAAGGDPNDTWSYLSNLTEV